MKFNREQVVQSWQNLRKWLRGFWLDIWLRLSGLRFSVSLDAAKRDGNMAEKAQKQQRWRFLRINALSPREQIRYFYLSTLRRARDKGVERQESETPLEFVDDLKHSWPETEHDVEQLTDAFLKARYSPDPIEVEDVPSVKDTWKNVRANLRKPTSKPDASQSATEPEDS